MRIELLNSSHIEALFEFEQQNRIWFEQFVPPRPDTYFFLHSFIDATQSLLTQQEEEEGFFHVVLDQDEIIARVNLTKTSSNEAELGYRVSQSRIGQGVASYGVSKVIESARNEYNLTLLTAMVATEHHASQRVLTKHGFQLSSQRKTHQMLNGHSIQLQHYEKLLS